MTHHWRKFYPSLHSILLALLLTAPVAQALEDVPRIAGPVEFRVELVDESTLAFSWRDTLLNEAPVDYYRIHESGQQIAQVGDSRWRLEQISRDAMYDFSVSAVLKDGTETRRSNRVYIDLPPLPGAVDGGNALLPPLQNVRAAVVDQTTATLSWEPAQAFWVPAAQEPVAFEYRIWIDNTLVDSTNETSLTYDRFPVNARTWVGISVKHSFENYSRQSDYVLVDTRKQAGTESRGVPGFGSVKNLESVVYSPSAGEVFWEGDGGSPSAYHVFVNGVLVARTEGGTSQYLGELDPGHVTQVSVGPAWPYQDNGHDGLLSTISVETPPGDSATPRNPTHVTGLRAEVYSPTATELFWDRARALSATYRVFLDGEQVAETDGASWFLEGLTPGTETKATVTAFGLDGTETEAAEVRFYNPTPFGDDVCQVHNLRAVTYSSTAAEIFWDRNPAGPAYSLSFDGNTPVITTAISWFLDSMPTGSDHEVTISVADPVCASGVTSIRFQLPDD